MYSCHILIGMVISMVDPRVKNMLVCSVKWCHHINKSFCVASVLDTFTKSTLLSLPSFASSKGLTCIYLAPRLAKLAYFIMLYTCFSHCPELSKNILHRQKLTRCREIKINSFDGRVDDKFYSVGLVRISKIFATQKVSFWLQHSFTEYIILNYTALCSKNERGIPDSHANSNISLSGYEANCKDPGIPW